MGKTKTQLQGAASCVKFGCILLVIIGVLLGCPLWGGCAHAQELNRAHDVVPRPTLGLIGKYGRGPRPPKRKYYPDRVPLPAYTVMHVSVYGSDSNDGASWGTAKASIGAAYNALPICRLRAPVSPSGQFQTVATPCGKIYLAANPAGYQLSSTITIVGEAVQIETTGTQETQINCSASTCIKITNGALFNGSPSNFSNGLKGISLVGSGIPNQVGFLLLDATGTILSDLHVSGFTGPGSAGVEIAADSRGYGERILGTNIFLEDNTCGLKYSSSGSAANNSFGHSFWFGLDITLFDNQTGICFGDNVAIYSSGFSGVINGSNQPGAAATAISISPHGTSVRGAFNIADDAGGSEAIRWCSGCTVNNFAGHGFVFQNNSNFHTQDSPIQIVTSELSEPTNSLCFFTGNPSSSTPRGCWFIDGTGNMDWSNPSSDHEYFSINGANGSLTVGSGSAMTSTGAGGEMASIGANGVSAGKITLAEGFGSHTFTTGYNSAPVCTASDSSSATAVKVLSTSTTVSVFAAGNDVVSWICVPAAN